MTEFWTRRPVIQAALVPDRAALDAFIATLDADVLDPYPGNPDSQRITDLVVSEPTTGGWMIQYWFYDGTWNNTQTAIGDWGGYLVLIPPNQGRYVDLFFPLSVVEFNKQYEPAV